MTIDMLHTVLQHAKDLVGHTLDLHSPLPLGGLCLLLLVVVALLTRSNLNFRSGLKLTIQHWAEQYVETRQQESYFLNKFRSELQRETLSIKVRHPELEPIQHRVGLIGITACGKTAIVEKITNSLFVDIDSTEGTGIKEYRRVAAISYSVNPPKFVQHDFCFTEWGGEHGQLAPQYMAGWRQGASSRDLHDPRGVEALVLVVSLGKYNPALEKDKLPRHDRYVLDDLHVRAQVGEHFSRAVLKFLLTEEALTLCRTVVLFINMSDLLSGSMSEVSRQAIDQFQELITNIRNQLQKIGRPLATDPDFFKVIVGSAWSDHGLTSLSNHLYSRILPDMALKQNPLSNSIRRAL